MDHFARLGLLAALDLELVQLDQAYFARQRQWHPDRFVGRPADERARASIEAAALNDAYRTLRDPIGRAVYIASLKGVELPGDGKTIDDPDLLTEAMEAREALHEAATADEVGLLAEKARRDIATDLAGLASLLLQDDKPAIRKTLLRLRYLDKLVEEARARYMNLQRPRP